MQIRRCVWITIRKRIEASTEHDELPDAFLNRLRELIFGIARAGDKEGAESPGCAAIDFRWMILQRCNGFRVEDAESKGIFEHERPVEYLMCRSAGCDAKGGSAGTGFFHLLPILASYR
jgi:hypothetical protein